MGWWSESIMGGDGPWDWKGEFEDTFGSEDETFNEYRVEDGKEPLPFVVPTAEAALAFITKTEENVTQFYKMSEDGAILRQVTGFLLLERGAPLNDELRAAILWGIDEELAGGCETWCSPDQRIAELQGFRKLVESYPDAGAKIEMPHQPGLFEKMAQAFGG